MRTLLAGLFDPLAQTGAAGKFGAGRAHDGVLDGAEADEAGEDLFEVWALGIGRGIRASHSIGLLISAGRADAVRRAARARRCTRS